MSNIHRKILINDKRKSFHDVVLLQPIPEIKVENKLDAIIYIQSFVRMWKQRKKFFNIKNAVIKIQNFFKSKRIRKVFLLVIDAIVFIQSVFRGYRVRKTYKHLLSFDSLNK